VVYSLGIREDLSGDWELEIGEEELEDLSAVEFDGESDDTLIIIIHVLESASLLNVL
jgi:hypothetical protein